MVAGQVVGFVGLWCHESETRAYVERELSAACSNRWRSLWWIGMKRRLCMTISPSCLSHPPLPRCTCPNYNRIAPWEARPAVCLWSNEIAPNSETKLYWITRAESKWFVLMRLYLCWAIKCCSNGGLEFSILTASKSVIFSFCDHDKKLFGFGKSVWHTRPKVSITYLTST